MPTCNNCIHSSVCTPYNTPNDEYPNIGDCPHFRDKANLVEVKYGEWKWGHQNGQYGIYCTNCKAMFVDKGNVEEIAYSHDYCPKCGANMKGGAE